ncbi:transposase [Ferruginibacter sp. SUN106]|uniref:transposase n=1 Tax=Ferruginibacter sp. SUN106 TaxID=2978348 RepID=UPI003D35E98E
MELVAIENKRRAVTKEEKYNEQKRYFGLIDAYLDSNLNEPYWLKQPGIASIVTDSLHYCNEKFYKLWCYCIMPNHVHLVITTLKDGLPLYTILQKHKRHTALQCNKVLKRLGQFWAQESYDHIVRNKEEFERIIFYTINNAVKAGFVKDWKEWEWTYINPELERMF